MRSSTTRSGCVRRHSSTPAGPSAATSTVKPSLRRRAATAAAIVSSSSTTTIVRDPIGRERTKGAVQESCVRCGDFVKT